jgi:hypothetical protein
MKVLLTHTPQARVQYYGERSLSGLQAIADVKLHQGDAARGRARSFRGCQNCAPSFAVRSISATSMSTPLPKRACW